MKIKMPAKPSLYTSLRILLLIGYAIVFTKFGYENRCHFINCTPASWKQILDVAVAQSGQDFRIETVSARPSWWNTNTEKGPTFVVINVSYVSPEIDNSQTMAVADQIANHPMKSVEFDDQSLLAKVLAGDGWTSGVPPANRQEVLQRITVHPRDAFRKTWMLAVKEAGSSSKNINVFAQLAFDVHGCEAAWRVTYVYDTVVLTYYIDGQTGQLVYSEKNVVSE